MLAWVGQFLMKDFQAFLSFARSLLTFLSFRSLLITLLDVFLGRSLGTLTLTLKAFHALNRVFSSILSRWPNSCILISCKHSLMLLIFSLVVSSSAEVLSSGQIWHIHLMLFIFSLAVSSSAEVLSSGQTWHIHLMLFIFSLAVSSSAEVLSSGQTWHIHLMILASFFHSLITSFLTHQVSIRIA